MVSVLFRINIIHNIETIASFCQRNMLRYLSADIICSTKRTVFGERGLRNTVSFEEEILSRDKCPSIILRQMEAIAFIILPIFRSTRAVLKIGECHLDMP